MSLIKASRTFKPMKYPQAFEHWETHDKMVWHYDEVALADEYKTLLRLMRRRRNLSHK